LLMGGRAAEERSKSCSRWIDRFGRWKSPAFEISRPQVPDTLCYSPSLATPVIVWFLYDEYHDLNLKTTAATCDAYKCGVLSFKKRKKARNLFKCNRIIHLSVRTNLNL
jgi:hypothetical protein